MALPFASALLLLACVAVTAARAEEAPVSVRVTPQLCVEGCSVRITVRVTPSDDNRALTIEADSTTFFRSSTIQLDGDRSPVLHLLLLKALPSGVYEVRATLTRENDVMRSAAPLRVYGTS